MGNVLKLKSRLIEDHNQRVPLPLCGICRTACASAFGSHNPEMLRARQQPSGPAKSNKCNGVVSKIELSLFQGQYEITVIPLGSGKPSSALSISLDHLLQR
jgi:hypothetical protein